MTVPSKISPAKSHPSVPDRLRSRTIATRQRLSSKFLDALNKDFQNHGAEAIEEFRLSKPDKYVQLIASLLPKEANFSVTADVTNNNNVTIGLEATSAFLSELLEKQAQQVITQDNDDENIIDVTPEEVAFSKINGQLKPGFNGADRSETSEVPEDTSDDDEQPSES